MSQNNRRHWVMEKEHSWIGRIRDWQDRMEEPRLEDKFRNSDTPYKSTPSNRQPTCNIRPAVNNPDISLSSSSNVEDRNPTSSTQNIRPPIDIPDKSSSDVHNRQPMWNRQNMRPPIDIPDGFSSSDDEQDRQLKLKRLSICSSIDIPDRSSPTQDRLPTWNRQHIHSEINIPDRSSSTLNTQNRQQSIYNSDKLLTSDIQDSQSTLPRWIRRQSICSQSDLQDSLSQTLSDIQDSQLTWNRRNRRSAIYIPDRSSTSDTQDLTWNRQNRRSAIYIPDRQTPSNIRNINRRYWSNQEECASLVVPPSSRIPQPISVVQRPSSTVTITMYQTTKTATNTRRMWQTPTTSTRILNVDQDRIQTNLSSKSPQK